MLTVFSQSSQNDFKSKMDVLRFCGYCFDFVIHTIMNYAESVQYAWKPSFNVL